MQSEQNRQSHENDHPSGGRKFPSYEEFRDGILDREGLPNESFDTIDGERSLFRVWMELVAIPPAEVRRLVVSAPNAVATGLYYAELYQKDRQRFDNGFKAAEFDVRDFDDLEDRAKAFWQADILLRQATDSDGPLQELIHQAKPLRRRLLKAANYLWGDDEKLKDVVAAIRNGNGHMNKADDLGSLATLFADNWTRINGKCDVTEADIDNAQDLGARMLKIMGARDQVTVTELRDIRDRACEYLRRGVEEVRAAALFVFRDSPEAMRRYPKMYNRKRKKLNGQANEAVETEIQAPAQDQATPAMAEEAPPVQAPVDTGALQATPAAPVELSTTG